MRLYKMTSSIAQQSFDELEVQIFMAIEMYRNDIDFDNFLATWKSDSFVADWIGENGRHAAHFLVCNSLPHLANYAAALVDYHVNEDC